MSTLSNTDPFNVGDYSNSLYNPNGLDEFGVWDKILTDSEVTELYNNGYGLQHPFTDVGSTLLQGVTNYWKLDETSGTTAVDTVGTVDGTLTAGTFDVGGKINYSYYNTGTLGDYGISMGNNLTILHNSILTINMWVKVEDISDTTVFFSKYDGDKGTYFYRSTTGYLYWLLRSDDTFKNRIDSSPGIITDTNWHMITATYDGTGTHTVVDFTDYAKLIVEHYDGGTITGGEPMDQYKPLMEFCKFIKSNTNMDILVYSGYTIEQIIEKYPDGLFMKYIDLLIDGPYYETSHSDSGDRGSLNQRMYEFKSGSPLEIKKPLSTGQWSVSVSDNSEVYMSGIPKKDEMKKIKKILEHKGIGISFK